MSSNIKSSEIPGMEYDPTFINSRKEAIIIFSVWILALLWTIPYCYLNGYPTDFDPDKMELVLGMPSWIVWGVAFPWMICNLFTVWFCLFYMKDDDLGENDDLPTENSKPENAKPEGEVQP